MYGKNGLSHNKILIIILYYMFDFKIKGIPEVLYQIAHDESLPAKPECVI